MSDEQLIEDLAIVESCVMHYGDEIDAASMLRLRARLEAQPDRERVAAALYAQLTGGAPESWVRKYTEMVDLADAAIAAIRGDAP